MVRLLPLYYLALALSMLTGSYSVHWLGNEGSVSIWNVISHVFLVHGFFPHYIDSMLGVDWYLGVLVIFLFITPLLYKFIDSFEKSMCFLVFITIFNPLLIKGISHILPVSEDPIVYDAYISAFSPLTRIMVFSFGIILFFAFKNFNISENANKKLMSYSLLFFSLIMMWGQITKINLLYRITDIEMYGIWCALIVFSQNIYGSKIINNPLFRICGRYSYGMYLFQYIWLNVYDKYLATFGWTGWLGWLQKFLLSVFILLAFSVLITRFFDTPIRKWINRIIYRF